MAICDQYKISYTMTKAAGC